MKFVLTSLFVAIGSFVAISEGERFLQDFSPQAAEATARYSLRAVADAARIEAYQNDAIDTTDFLDDVVDRTPNKDALTVNADGSVEWSDGTHCLRLYGGPVEADDRIVPCE